MDASPLKLSTPKQAIQPRVRSAARKRQWTIRGALSGRQYAIYAILGVATPILAWAFVNEAGIVPKIFMPGPWDVVKRFWSWIANEGFAGDLLISLQRVSLGFLASLVVALPLGLLAGTFKPAEAFLEPAMDFIRYMPAVAFVPLMMLWCGVGELSKVSIIFIGTFFQMVLMFARSQGADAADRGRTDHGRHSARNSLQSHLPVGRAVTSHHLPDHAWLGLDLSRRRRDRRSELRARLCGTQSSALFADR
jgi:ABC-type phosphate/phosphonate transport system permease subunit